MPKQWVVYEVSKEGDAWKEVSRTGILRKKGGGMSTAGRRNWKKRFFVLQGGVLTYSQKADSPELGVISLQGASIDSASRTASASYEIIIATAPPDARRYVLAAESSTERDDWLKDLRAVVGSLSSGAQTRELLAVVSRQGLDILDSRTQRSEGSFPLPTLRNFVAQGDFFCFCADVHGRPVGFKFRCAQDPQWIVDALADEAQHLANDKKKRKSKTRRSRAGSSLTGAPPGAASGTERELHARRRARRGGGGGGGGSGGGGALGSARVLFDYKPNAPGKLTLYRGEVVTVTEAVSSDWWKGELNGAEGLFPRAYVRALSDEIRATALYDFDDEKVKHLRFKKGDVIVLLSKIQDSEWWEGMAGGRVGIFPISLVEVITNQMEFRRLHNA